MNITLRQLRVLVAIDQSGSLTGAATRLNVTQSAISTTLRDIEAALEAPLFQRTTRRLAPTAAGVAALALAKSLLSDAEEFERRVRAAAEQEAGAVTFAATAAIAAAMGPRLIARFRASHPHIAVRMLDVAPDAIAKPVLSGEAAFSIGTPNEHHLGLTVERLHEDRLSVITWREGPFHDRTEVAWQELTDVPTISVTRGGGIRELIDRQLAAAGTQFTPSAECRFLATALAMANERLGVLILPSLLTSGGRGEFIAVPLVDPPVFRQIALMRLAGHPLSQPARDLVAETKRLAAMGPHLS